MDCTFAESAADPQFAGRAIVVMGVSGAGKSTVAAALAAARGGPCIDADDLHSEKAIDRMRSGTPLTDADRWPWLDRVGASITRAAGEGHAVTVACSALRRTYRDRLRAATAVPLWFVQLDVSRAALLARLHLRVGHFMPAALLDSQLDTLEPLAPDEPGTAIDAALPVNQIVASVTARLLRE
ncbi:gluconokinase [Leucobacter sp. NPDC077196]|uniref:gluconokinase n=1 Tax=Leucobacter sp. NPDC077196 TaxID=3154959 RepID=UPI00341DE106